MGDVDKIATSAKAATVIARMQQPEVVTNISFPPSSLRKSGDV